MLQQATNVRVNVSPRILLLFELPNLLVVLGLNENPIVSMAQESKEY